MPEGLIEFIPEMNELLADLNDKVAIYESEMKNLHVDEKENYIYDKTQQ